MTKKELDEIAEQLKKIDQLMKDFQRVANSITTDELSLLDIVAKEEKAKNITDEMNEAIKEIIDIRQFAALNDNTSGPF